LHSHRDRMPRVWTQGKPCRHSRRVHLNGAFTVPTLPALQPVEVSTRYDQVCLNSLPNNDARQQYLWQASNLVAACKQTAEKKGLYCLLNCVSACTECW
jgi:hypothetical protein